LFDERDDAIVGVLHRTNELRQTALARREAIELLAPVSRVDHRFAVFSKGGAVGGAHAIHTQVSSSSGRAPSSSPSTPIRLRIVSSTVSLHTRQSARGFGHCARGPSGIWKPPLLRRPPPYGRPSGPTPNASRSHAAGSTAASVVRSDPSIHPSTRP